MTCLDLGAAPKTVSKVTKLAAALWVVLVATGTMVGNAQARCGDDPGDAADMADVRELIETKCPCITFPSRSDYLRCARTVIDGSVNQGRLRRECKSTVRRCTSKSTCGSPGWVTCCRTNARGKTRCVVKRDAASCTAPGGGSACVSDYRSCCDACSASGCLYRPTPTPAPTPTVPAFCQAQIGVPTVAVVPFSTTAGSPDCTTEPEEPFVSGQVFDGSGNEIKKLGAGCLYTGALAGSAVPDGGVSKLSVTGVNGLTVTLGPNGGTSPFDCTLGSGPSAACLNGAPGLDGNGTCYDASDCGGGLGVCAPKPNCYFGPPVPIGGLTPVCVVNSFLAPLCGNVDLASTDVSMTTALTAAVFLTGNFDSPCPQCLEGVCTAGPRAGLTCAPVGSAQTSIDCLPDPSAYRTKLTVMFTELTTGTSELEDTAGLFCPGQTVAGAFGLPAARHVVETGAGIGSGGLGAPFATRLVGVFCIPSTGHPLVDFGGGFPAISAFSAVGEIDLTNVIPAP